MLCNRHRLRLTCLAALGALALSAAAVAHGESKQEGNLVVSLGGRITPYALPREVPAPVVAHVTSAIKSANGASPPQLRKFSIALNRAGTLFTRGLPVCPEGVLESTTSVGALAACRAALIGSGNFQANVSFPTLAPFPAAGRVLAFNGRLHGKPVILLHIYGSKPVQHTFVLPMSISHPPKGIYGTVLTTTIPTIAAELGYVTGVQFNIGRQYRYKGAARSLLSARCAAPAGFPSAIFDFARGTFSFANGQTISTSLVRDCKVRN